MDARSIETDEGATIRSDRPSTQGESHDNDDDDDDDSDAPAGPGGSAEAAGEGESRDGEGEEGEEEEEEEGSPTAPGNGGSSANENNDGTDPDDNHLIITAVPDLKSLEGLRELGPEAVCWQLSSAKPGNGVEQIRDPSLDTYWQSDGQAQPHWIQLHFARRVAISHVCLYCDFAHDESYTPRKISVDAGCTQQDLQEAVPLVELNEPSGWAILPLRSPPDPLDAYYEDDGDGDFYDPDNDLSYKLDGNRVNAGSSSAPPNSNSNNNNRLYNNRHVVRAHLIRISIQAMHQNGRDTHVRQVRIFGPRMMSQQQAVTTTAAATNRGSATPFRSSLAARNDPRDNNRAFGKWPSLLDDTTTWNGSGSQSIHDTRFTSVR
jgi:anaphase-promoting complex subunit 10